VLGLPELVYLVFPKFEPCALVYPAFTVFELLLLIPVCVCLALVYLLSVVLLSVVPLADLISSRLFASLVFLAIVLCRLV
jgi:hypothetical protein